MKTFRTRSRNSLVLFLSLTLASPLMAKPVAQVTELTGQVFAITPDGKTTALKINHKLDEKSEVMVEEGGTITLNDYYDATYHLIGGTHIKFFDKSVQLKRGKAWIQSTSTRHPLALTTANGHVDFWKAEFVATFDQSKSRSQVLVVNGDVDVSNVLERDMKYSVAAGTFTLIDPEVDDGLPRTPTKVGLTSLNAALGEFKKLPQKMIETQAPARNIASVEETPVKKGEILFINSKGNMMKRLPASVGKAHQYFKAKVKASKAVGAPIKFYGISVKTVAPQTKRIPASLKPMTPKNGQSSFKNQINIDQEFSDSLKKQRESQPKYSKELNSLIEDLKSY